ncbi:MAG: hypothetical protein L0Z50_12845 [Verrucomicrobiales bacterium]|nr:hypothetical protein [Verrucomicrobiales bacterium]
MTLIAYFGDAALKADLIEEIRSHREHDQIVKGHYGRMNSRWTGCAIGCSIRSLNLRRGLDLPTNDHRIYETHLGIPQVVAQLEDAIFEGLPDDRYLHWPEQVAAAIRPGADLSSVWPKFALWLFTDSRLLFITDINQAAIKEVADLYAQWVAGKEPSAEAWRAADVAAAAAADAAAVAAAAAIADVAAAWRNVAAAWCTATAAAAQRAADVAAAADVVAVAAAAAIADVAAATAAAAVADVARQSARTKAWSAMADKLLFLLRAA